MKDKLVSVVIITYFQKYELGEAIQSVLNQDYSNIEIIVSDDYSIDGSFEYNQEKFKHYPNILFVQTPQNLDITGNCNHALQFVNGDYVVFMGGDDLLLPQKISSQVSFMESNLNCGVSFHTVERVEINTLKHINYMGQSYNGGAELMLKYGTINPAVGSMYRREAIGNLKFDERVRVASDWLFTTECLINSGMSINYMEGCFAKYRIGEENASSKRYRKGNTDHLISRLIIAEKYPMYESLVPYSFRQYVFRMRRGYDYGFINKWFKIDLLYIKTKVAWFYNYVFKQSKI